MKKELVIFMESCGPNVFKENILETVNTLKENLGIKDYDFYVVVDTDEAGRYVCSVIDSNNLLGIIRSKSSWAEDFNIFLSRHQEDYRYLLITHDDIVLKTPNAYCITMQEINGLEDKIGWITYTNVHYYSVNASNSIRGGFYKDRLLFEMYECHNKNNTFDYPKRPVKTYGPYSHLNLISMNAMKAVGLCPDWTKYTILIDEDWALTSLIKGFTNVWVPQILYDHPNSKQVTMRVSDLRYEQEAHAKFIQKWGFDTPFSDQTIASILSAHPELSYLANRYSYEWTYLK